MSIYGQGSGYLRSRPNLRSCTLLYARGPPLPKRAYEISNLPKDFKISAKISDFSRFSKRFQDFREDFKISAKISDFAKISAEISRSRDFW